MTGVPIGGAGGLGAGGAGGLAAGGATGAAGTGGALGPLGGLLAAKGMAAVAAGLIAGAASGGALVATGAVSFNQQAGGPVPSAAVADVALAVCPGSGDVLNRVANGQQLLVTGRSADGAWLQVYVPQPGIDRAWVPASAVQLQGDGTSLPTQVCAPPASAGPSQEASASVAPSANAVLTASAPPPASPAPSVTGPNGGGPNLSGLSSSHSSISGGDHSYCPNDPISTTISVSAVDPDGVANVALFFKRPGSASFSSKSMTQSAGSNVWVATIATDADSIGTAGTLSFYVVATDNNANPETSRLPTSGSDGIKVKICVNSGPTFTLTSSDVSKVDTNPTGLGVCPDALGTGITAKATDIDGVKSMTLFFKGPGMTATKSRAMTPNPPTWNSFINPTNDGITFSGTISWWIVATDTKGATTKSSTKSIQVVRCDSEATITSSESPSSFTYSCGPVGALTFTISASDPDNPQSNPPLGVSVTWQLHNTGTGATDNGTSTGGFQGGTTYSASISDTITNTWEPHTPSFVGSDELTWTVTTTDQYGGTSSHFFSTTITISTC